MSLHEGLEMWLIMVIELHDCPILWFFFIDDYDDYAIPMFSFSYPISHVLMAICYLQLSWLLYLLNRGTHCS